MTINGAGQFIFTGSSASCSLTTNGAVSLFLTLSSTFTGTVTLQDELTLTTNLTARSEHL